MAKKKAKKKRPPRPAGSKAPANNTAADNTTANGSSGNGAAKPRSSSDGKASASKSPKTASNAPKSKAGTATAAKPKTTTARQAAARRQGSAPKRRQGKQMSATTSWVVLGAGIVVIVGIVLFIAVQSQGDTGSGEVADDASAWDLPALDSEGDVDGDGRITLEEFNGKPTIVNFFASWCVECNRELPAFRTLAEEIGDEVNFVFVNANETGNWRPMANEHGITPFPLVDDIGPSDNRLYLALGGTVGMPITAFYDADGNHVFTNPGGMTIETVTATLERFDLLRSAA